MDGAELLPDLDGTEPGLVVLMCGLPGSGKSTCAKALERRGFVRLSIDEVVWARIGHDPARLDPAVYERLKAEAEEELWQELVRLLEARRPVVIDYSFWRRSTRDRYKALIERHGCRWELIRLRAELPVLLRRLAARSLHGGANSVTVPEEVLRRYYDAFEEPVGEGERVVVQH
ncbi:ATP-binding protein [Kitasatospora sp. NA04385]|nr:ATP-binding protein [Kitasatospora sp. NA04385]